MRCRSYATDGTTTRYHDGRHVDNLPGSSVALNVRLPENLLVRFLPEIQLLGETLERVGALSDSRRFPQARHMHRATSKSVHLDSLVMKLVTVEAIVVKHLLDGRVFQIVLEVLQCAVRLVQVVDPYARPRAEVVLGPAINGCTNYLSVSYALIAKTPPIPMGERSMLMSVTSVSIA